MTSFLIPLSLYRFPMYSNYEKKFMTNDEQSRASFSSFPSATTTTTTSPNPTTYHSSKDTLLQKGRTRLQRPLLPPSASSTASCSRILQQPPVRPRVYSLTISITQITTILLRSKKTAPIHNASQFPARLNKCMTFDLC